MDENNMKVSQKIQKEGLGECRKKYYKAWKNKK